MSFSDPPIDWTALALEVRTPGDSSEIVTTDHARAALAAILGRAQIVHAVEHYLALDPGFELARGVLWLLRPPAAMHECRRIYLEDACLECRISAVELLRVVATREALAWVDGFLSDPEPGIQSWGMGVLDQLVWSNLLREGDEPTVEALLARGSAHENEAVRNTARFVRGVIDSRREHPCGDPPPRP